MQQVAPSGRPLTSDRLRRRKNHWTGRAGDPSLRGDHCPSYLAALLPAKKATEKAQFKKSIQLGNVEIKQLCQSTGDDSFQLSERRWSVPSPASHGGAWPTVCLFERQSDREQEIPSIIWLTPRMATQPGLVWTEVRSPRCHLGGRNPSG